MRICLTVFLLFSYGLVPAQEGAAILPKEIQITTAVLPLSDTEKAGAKVYGYNEEGKLVVLREGNNNMVCIADDPEKEGIQAACYAVALEPFMERGRELNAMGKDFREKEEIRANEVADGKLKMPDAPSMLYIFYGKDEDYDKTTGLLANGKFRYVVYIPFATTQATGLPDKPHSPGMPWLMDPGTYRAHIMIGPFN